MVWLYTYTCHWWLSHRQHQAIIYTHSDWSSITYIHTQGMHFLWRNGSWCYCFHGGHHFGPAGRFKNTYELLNLRALKFSPVNKTHIFQCMSKIFCVEFQRVALKFPKNYVTHTLNYNMVRWIFAPCTMHFRPRYDTFWPCCLFTLLLFCKHPPPPPPPHTHQINMKPRWEVKLWGYFQGMFWKIYHHINDSFLNNTTYQ